MGRLPRAELDSRRAEIRRAAQELLEELGFERFTMLRVAERCGASKETLYSWFGNKDGLIGELIADSGRQTVERLQEALQGHDQQVLQTFARALLRLLVSPWSVAVNRAAMTSPDLAGLLLQHGRHGVGPLVESYLARLDSQGVLHVDDPSTAFTELYGLVVRDTQIRVLLGESAPAPAALQAQADAGVDQFWRAHTGPET